MKNAKALSKAINLLLLLLRACVKLNHMIFFVLRGVRTGILIAEKFFPIFMPKLILLPYPLSDAIFFLFFSPKKAAEIKDMLRPGGLFCALVSCRFSKRGGGEGGSINFHLSTFSFDAVKKVFV
jgi:hypothetical protein